MAKAVPSRHSGVMVAELVEWIETIASYPWFPIVVVVVAALDAVFPVVPSETAVIVGGVTAGLGDQNLAVIALAGAMGAFLGDNLAYQIGATAGRSYRRRASRRARRRLAWARVQLRRRSAELLIAARFIPGGRTAVTVGSGMIRHPRFRFALTIAVAGLLWAGYAAGLGYLFGEVFRQDHTAAFLSAFAVAALVVAITEVTRRWRDRKRRKSRGLRHGLDPAA